MTDRFVCEVFSNLLESPHYVGKPVLNYYHPYVQGTQNIKLILNFKDYCMGTYPTS